MECASCGEIIEGDPIWEDGQAYCSEECAEAGPMLNDSDDDYDKEYQQEYEEELDVE